MTKTNSLYDYAERHQIDIIEADIPYNCLKGLYFDNTIVLDNSIDTTSELRCVLAEEIGHYESTTGHILDQTSIPAAKQELKAHRLAHKLLITFDDLTEAFSYPCRSAYEIADFLDVTEDFLYEAIDNYKQIYGPYVIHNEYIIYFEPLGVMKMFSSVE